jgi:hypothetical protein
MTTLLWPELWAQGLRKRGITALVFSVGITFMVLGCMSLLPSPVPHLSINLKSEVLRYRVKSPAISAFVVENADINGFDCDEGKQNNGRFSGMVTPAIYNIVTYRLEENRYAIQIKYKPNMDKPDDKKTGSFKLLNEKECELPTGTVTLAMPIPVKSSSAWTPLPISGPAEAGAEISEVVPMAPESKRVRSLLLGGTIQVFGRTAFPISGGSLYIVSEGEFPIVTGSRVAAGREIESADPHESGAPWYGVAMFGEMGFEIAATTETRAMLIHRSGLGQQTERFAVGYLARLFNDPSLAGISFAIFVFSLVAQLLMSWMQLWDVTGRSKPRSSINAEALVDQVEHDI